MKREYDFSKAKRGAIAKTGHPELREAVSAAKHLLAKFGESDLPPGKERITIRLDEEVIDAFMRMADASGGRTGYQTLINSALREYLEGKTPKFEETLRRIVREEVGEGLRKAKAG